MHELVSTKHSENVLRDLGPLRIHLGTDEDRRQDYSYYELQFSSKIILKEVLHRQSELILTAKFNF